MASLPRTMKDFLREIERMEEEIAIHKLNIEGNIREYTKVERLIKEVNMLQDKARHVIKCNERKSKRYREELEEIEQCFLRCKNVRTVGCNDTFTDLTAKIGDTKEIEMKLEDKYNNQKQNSGQVTTLPELTRRYEKIKEEYDFGNIKSEI